jgi:hypothetical protein
MNRVIICVAGCVVAASVSGGNLLKLSAIGTALIVIGSYLIKLHMDKNKNT